MAWKKIDIYGGRDPREIPVYTYREAARCLNISPSTLKAWTVGQSNFSPILTSPAGGDQLSFFNVVEAWVVYDLRHRFHFSLQSLRRPDSPKTIVVDPTIAFGKPVIAGTGIPTAAIYQLFNAGDSIVDIAEDHDRTPQEIEDAIRYESVRSKAA